MNRWRIRKAQCQTCIEMRAEYGSDNYGGDGQPVWVVYRDGGEFGCRPTFSEAIEYAHEYAHRKAKVLG